MGVLLQCAHHASSCSVLIMPHHAVCSSCLIMQCAHHAGRRNSCRRERVSCLCSSGGVWVSYFLHKPMKYPGDAQCSPARPQCSPARPQCSPARPHEPQAALGAIVCVVPYLSLVDIGKGREGPCPISPPRRRGGTRGSDGQRGGHPLQPPHGPHLHPTCEELTRALRGGIAVLQCTALMYCA